MNVKVILASIFVLLSLSLPRMGVAGNGIMQFEIPFDTTLYVSCLGEDVDIELLATVRTHLVQSQNGRVHYVENWFIEGSATGAESAHTWFAHGASPFVDNHGAGQANSKLVANVVYEPLDGGQKFRERIQFQLVIDANGVVRLEDGFQKFYCIGAD